MDHVRLKVTFEPLELVPRKDPYVVLLDSQGSVLKSPTEPVTSAK